MGGGKLVFRYRGDFSQEGWKRQADKRRATWERGKTHMTERHSPRPTGMSDNPSTYSGVEMKNAASESRVCRHPFYGALKGFIRFVPGVDLTEPADPEWGERIWGDEKK
jgi:hypothetical protein